MKKVIKCGEFFDAVDGKVQKNVAVTIEGNKIVAIGPADAACCKDAEVIDLSNKFVMPGLIDAHLHSTMDGEPTMASQYTNLHGDYAIAATVNVMKDLMAGFTSIRDEGSVAFTDVSCKKAIEKGLVPGPRMMCAGVPIGTTGGHCDSNLHPYITGESSMGRIINSPDEARAAARWVFKYGADQIKLMATGGVMSLGDDPNHSDMTLEEMKAALDIANSRGRVSTAHAHGAEGIKFAVLAGITSIEHGMLMDDECIDLMAEHGTYLVPTIIAAYNIVEAGIAGGINPENVEKAKLVLANHKENLRKCREKGVKIGFGTDAGTPYNYHGKQTFEFELMVDFGFTPADTLMAATKVNATMMKWIDKVGTLEVGKLADVVAFDRSPLEDIKVMNECSFVMKDGVVYKG